MTTCWHCATEPADPKAAQTVKLHRGTTERSVRVPTCAACGRVIRLADGLLVGLALVGVAAGVALGLATANLLVGVGVFLAAWALGGIVAFVIRTAKGIKVNDHPEVRRLRADGWKLGGAPKPAGASAQKTCSRCGKVVPLSAHRGQSCPHCGAYWSYENEQRSTRPR